MATKKTKGGKPKNMPMGPAMDMGQPMMGSKKKAKKPAKATKPMGNKY